MTLTEWMIEELKHDAEAARAVGKTMVVRVNCETLLALLAEIERHRLTSLVFERNALHPASRD